MPAPNRKSKMLSVRISQEEYESLRAMYEARGIRSVSKLARDAMRSFLKGTGHNTDTAPSNHGDCEDKIRFLDAKLNTLKAEVSQLSRLLADTLKKEA